MGLNKCKVVNGYYTWRELDVPYEGTFKGNFEMNVMSCGKHIRAKSTQEHIKECNDEKN